MSTLPVSTASTANQNNNANNKNVKITIATQTGQETPDMSFNPEKMINDENCYECKIKYRDPKPKDLVMYLHAWKYKVRILLIFFFLIYG